MQDFLLAFYPWMKAFHVISVIFWMAGMYYLPRLFVYHCEAAPGSVLSENYKRMERLLLRRIINPAMIAAWVFAMALIFTPDVVNWQTDHWFQVKLGAVILLSAYHGYLSRWRRAFERDERPFSGKTFRILNEVPPVLTVIIVIMVIVRPF